MDLTSTILAFLTFSLAGASGGAAELVFEVVTPDVSIVPLGARVPLTATGHFTDGSTRRLSHATIAAGGNHGCALLANDVHFVN